MWGVDVSAMRRTAFILALLIPCSAQAFDPEKGEADLGDLGATRDARAFADAVKLERLERAFLMEQGERGDLEVPEAILRHPEAAPGVTAAIDEVFAEEDWEFPFGIDVRNREPVATFIRFWTGRGRSTFARVFARMGRYEDLIRGILREEGVPEDIIYLCFIESGFATRALSPANARGLWQFIPATGISHGLRIDGEVDERLDPVKGTRAAARYLKSLRDKTGSWPLAMAGYNAGSGHVLSAMNKGNSNSYFTLARRDVLYENTQNYVAKILAAGFVARNLEKFGIQAVTKEAPLEWDEVDVPGGTLLSDAARAAGTDVDALKVLNPELLHAVVPRRQDTYMLRIPQGTAAAFVASFDGVAPGGAHYTYHTRIGETLAMAASRVGVPARALRATNGIATDARVPYRTRLIVPASLIDPDGIEPGGALEPWLLRREATQRDRVQITALLPETRFAYADRAQWFYQTRKGDSLEELAAAFEVEAGDIAMWNALDADAPLRKGLVLQLFLPEGTRDAAVLFAAEDTDAVYEGTAAWTQAYASAHRRKPAGTASGGGRTYRVRAGDTLASVARKCGVAPADIKRWNNLRADRLKPGYRLVLYGAKKDPPRSGETRTARVATPSQTRRDPPARRPTRRATNVRFRKH